MPDYSDATGQMMIVGQGNFFIDTGDSSNRPPGTIERVPRPVKLGPRPKGRTAAALAALLSISLDLYRLAPRSLAWLSSAPPSTSIMPGMRWDTASLSHLPAIAAILVRTLPARQVPAPPEPGTTGTTATR